MIDSERLKHIRESVLRDSGRNFEDAYADRAWLLVKLDDLSSKLQERTKERDAMFASVTELEAERIALGNRLSSCADELQTEIRHVNNWMERAFEAERRLDTATRLLRVAVSEWGGWMDDARGVLPTEPEYAEATAFLASGVEKREQKSDHVPTIGPAYIPKT